MRFKGAGGGLAALVLIFSTTQLSATVLNPEMPSARAAGQSTAVTVHKSKLATTSAVATAVAKPKPKPARPTLYATIDLTQQRMTVRANGQQLHSWSISSGRSGYETPTGSFRPGWMARRWHSRKYNMAPMPYSVFFNGGIATHGTTAVGRLGRPASHGCIRLRTANARRFYNLVAKHGKARTRIIVKGRAKQTRYARRRPSHQAQSSRRRSLGVVGRGAPRYTARSYRSTHVYRPRTRVYRAPTRRFVYPGDRY